MAPLARVTAAAGFFLIGLTEGLGLFHGGRGETLFLFDSFALKEGALRRSEFCQDVLATGFSFL